MQSYNSLKYSFYVYNSNAHETQRKTVPHATTYAKPNDKDGDEE